MRSENKHANIEKSFIQDQEELITNLMEVQVVTVDQEDMEDQVAMEADQETMVVHQVLLHQWEGDTQIISNQVEL